MVISHKHKYIFIQLPRTGSTAVEAELIEHYDGENILEKHSTYRGLVREYGQKIDDYYIFSSIRNPIDRTISLYIKIKNGQGIFGSDSFRKKKKVRSFFFNRIVNFTQKENLSVSEFFLRVYRIPYDDWSSLDHHKFNYIIRYENLASDFSHILDELGIKQVRPLPVVNKTKGKDDNLLNELNSAAVQHAKKIFGPFMVKQGFQFPEHWGELNLNMFNWFNYYFWHHVRKFYWLFIRRV